MQDDGTVVEIDGTPEVTQETTNYVTEQVGDVVP